MRYSEYTTEQLIECSGDYSKLCNILFELAPNEETKLKLKSILFDGSYQGFSLSTNITRPNSIGVEAQRRISMAYLLLRNPETFDVLVQNKINLFHGTNANALPNILKFGLNSVNELNKLGLDVSTGEAAGITTSKDSRSFISFTDVLDVAKGYSKFKPTSEDKLLSFEVVIGTTKEEAKKAGLCKVLSNFAEIGLQNHLSIESIKVICVPADKVEFVKKLVDDTQIRVLPMHGFGEQIYYMDSLEVMHIWEEKIKKLKEYMASPIIKKEFTNNEVENLLKSNKLANIKKQLEKLRNVFSKDKEVNYARK